MQASPSLHEVLLGLLGFEHTPVAGLHAPASWHWSGAGHTSGAPLVHTPTWQVSFCVQPFPSLHATPLALLGFEQTPVAGLHAPASWH